MLSTTEITGLIKAYGRLITSRNALIAQYKHQGLNGLVARLKQAQREDWATVGELRNRIKQLACEGEKV